VHGIGYELLQWSEEGEGGCGGGEGRCPRGEGGNLFYFLTAYLSSVSEMFPMCLRCVK
jgi:hypothetical protein